MSSMRNKLVLASAAVTLPPLIALGWYGGSRVEMWSYPIIKDGLIYVVDARNGLYIIRYAGLWGEQVAREAFLEGNSNL